MSAEGIILKNGILVLKDDVVVGDLIIEEGFIVDRPSVQKKHIEIDCKGFYVCPGFIDIHCHFRDPGYTNIEDIFTGLKSAAAGGITAVSTMPNTNPVCDNKEIIEYQLEKSKEIDEVKLYPFSSMTMGEDGKHPVNFLEMKKSGAIGFTDDGKCVQNNRLIFEIAKEIKKIDSILVDHCEDYSLSKDGVVTEGKISKEFNLPYQNPLSEEIIVARDILIAKHTGVKIHLQHLSTKGSIQLVKWAKEKGLKVTSEVTPHHIYFSEEDIEVKDTNYKMNPPLRSENDRKYLIESILNGTIDVIASDHAPHTFEDKNRGFLIAPFGVIGLETLIPVVMTLLFHKNGMKINEIVKICSTNPAKLLKIKRDLKVGEEANITIIDPKRKFTVNKKFFHSKSKNSPFIGKDFIGKAVCTIVSGKICFSEL